MVAFKSFSRILRIETDRTRLLRNFLFKHLICGPHLFVFLIIKSDRIKLLIFVNNYFLSESISKLGANIFRNPFQFSKKNYNRMSGNQMQDQNKFKKHLAEYWASKGITQIKIPQIGGKQLNLFKLYKSVCKKGGGQAVSHNKMWKEIVDEFGLPSTCTSASFTLKNHYQKYLLGYEQKYYFGKDDSGDLPQLVAGRTRKPMTSGLRSHEEGGASLVINYMNKYGGERNVDNSSLSTELKKYYEKSDMNQQVNYIKRTKMYPSMPEVKRLILGFQSKLPEQINFSINTLLLYSVNTEAPFLFMQYPNVIQSIALYMKYIYPPKNLGELQILRSITLAIRNLAIDYRNLQPVQQSPIMEVFDKIFQDKIDKELSRNIVDIYSSLTNVGWDCTKLIEHIEDYLDKDSYEDLQTGIDLLKSLVEEKQEICEQIIVKKMQFFTKNLIHQQSFIREAILQIFAYITDKSDLVRHECAKNFNFMKRIFALIVNTYDCETQSQLAGYILSNLSKKEENMELLKKFEKQILLISFNDDSFSSITAPLLFKMSNREERIEQPFEANNNEAKEQIHEQ